MLMSDINLRNYITVNLCRNMYNYFTLLDCLEETLSMLKASSVCCIVIKENDVLINVNKSACDLLKIKDMYCNVNNTELAEMKKQIYNIIHQFMNGKKAFYAELVCADGSSVCVNIKVDSFQDLNDLFILRFNKISDAERTSNRAVDML